MKTSLAMVAAHRFTRLFGKKIRGLQMLVSDGAYLNTKSPAGEVPCHIVVEGYDKDVIKLLINHGAYIDTEDRYNLLSTPLHKAADRLDINILNLLLKKYNTEGFP